MKAVLYSGAMSLGANVLILLLFLPIVFVLQPWIIFQIAFWTFGAATGATATMHVIRTYSTKPNLRFITLAVIIFFLSLIPIYFRLGILRDFPSFLIPAAVEALYAMHAIDSLIISGVVIWFMRCAPIKSYELSAASV